MKDKEFISSLNSSEKEELQESLIIHNKEVWERYCEEVSSGLKVADEDFLYEIYPSHYSFTFDVDDQLKKFEKPTLFLVGRQDTTVGYHDAWKIIESYPRATFAVLDQAGHNLNIEKPVLFNSLVNEWLDRVEYQISMKEK